LVDPEEARRPKDRYFNDSLFHGYVDIFYRMFMEGKMTVGEMRDAVTFAGIKFEFERVAPRSLIPFIPEEKKERGELQKWVTYLDVSRSL